MSQRNQTKQQPQKQQQEENQPLIFKGKMTNLDSNKKCTVRRDNKPQFQNSWQAFETGSLGNMK